MAEEGTPGLARVRETAEEGLSKEQLQRRMDEARDSITHTVAGIKENVTQQYESVKDALDWREQFKKRPVAWSLGAAGVGFLVGYGIAAAVRDNEVPYYSGSLVAPVRQTRTAQAIDDSTVQPPVKSNGKHNGTSMLERFKETSAYERLSQEAGALGDRLVEELSVTAQTVVLPALLKKIKSWIGADLSAKTQTGVPDRTSSMGSKPAGTQQVTRTYDSSIEGTSNS